jgi:hypothetical protein
MRTPVVLFSECWEIGGRDILPSGDEANFAYLDLLPMLRNSGVSLLFPHTPSQRDAYFNTVTTLNLDLYIC